MAVTNQIVFHSSIRRQEDKDVYVTAPGKIDEPVSELLRVVPRQMLE
jgi:hypothetical protein